MLCNQCIYEPMCWRLAIGTYPTRECKDFFDKSVSLVHVAEGAYKFEYFKNNDDVQSI